MGESLFQTARSKVIEAYRKSGQPFNASTKPYMSTQSFLARVADLDAPNGIAYLVFDSGQVQEWMGYGVGDLVPSLGRTAKDSDTNLGKSRSTNGADDFIIEGMSASVSGVRTNTGRLVGGVPPGALPNLTDPAVRGAVEGSGLVQFMDQGSVISPPQVYSPFNLEDALMTALAPHIAIEFEWDRETVKKIGNLSQIPEGAAKSFLRSHGDPRTDDRYKIPEGYLWRRDGQPDSEFVARGRLDYSVVVPINLITYPNQTPQLLVPVAVAVEIQFRLHGLSVRIPGQN